MNQMNKMNKKEGAAAADAGERLIEIEPWSFQRANPPRRKRISPGEGNGILQHGGGVGQSRFSRKRGGFEAFPILVIFKILKSSAGAW